MTQLEALDILKTGANIFLTGEPGAGKTHTINTYIAYLRSHGVEPAITASTGIAATHIHGQTIHSWSGIGINKHLSHYDIDRIASTEYIVRRIKKNAVLIIDEISMIDAATLDAVDRVCREVRQNEEVFGGMQVVLVGDFFQLPPISKHGDVAYFAFEADVWKTMKPVVCYLTEQHRQSDRGYLSVLAAIRKNNYSEQHHDLIKKRKIAHADAAKQTITKLFSHNVNVDTINAHELEKLNGIPNRFTMTTKGRETLVMNLQKGCLSPETLELKIGAVVMCTKNNQQKGYVNGTLGEIRGFEPGTKYPIIETRKGERIVVEPADWVIEESGKIKASITQVPLRLAWAITIHKSQGMSLDAAVIDLGNVFEYGQGYVALSRVKAFDGLHLLGWNARAFQVHPRILQEDSAFIRQSASAGVIFGDMPKDRLTTMHHNFILAAGGTLDSPKKKEKKKDTLEETLMLVLQEKPIAAITKERQLTAATVFGHIEKLIAAKRLGKEDIEYLVDHKTFAALSDIRTTFLRYDTSKLTPVFDHYRGKHSFDQLRLARMVLSLAQNA